MERLVLDEDSTELHKACSGSGVVITSVHYMVFVEDVERVVGVVDEGDCWKVSFFQKRDSTEIMHSVCGSLLLTNCRQLCLFGDLDSWI